MDRIPEPTKTYNPFMFLDTIKKIVRLLEALRLMKGSNGITVTVTENGIVIDGADAGGGGTSTTIGGMTYDRASDTFTAVLMEAPVSNVRDYTSTT